VRGWGWGPLAVLLLSRTRSSDLPSTAKSQGRAGRKRFLLLALIHLSRSIQHGSEGQRPSLALLRLPGCSSLSGPSAREATSLSPSSCLRRWGTGRPLTPPWPGPQGKEEAAAWRISLFGFMII
jgi:hypothetical protein